MPQSGLPQKRRSSGTWASASTTPAGSRYGTAGTSTRPIPSWPRLDRLLDRLVPARAVPDMSSGMDGLVNGAEGGAGSGCGARPQASQ
ncbi:hypothetical protein Misp02_31010 [Microtetraspora sp. NBRC 16547]|nr:hypothetical protein Misp02_31010 [Microtetraspora sp. NBRC 16547]